MEKKKKVQDRVNTSLSSKARPTILRVWARITPTTGILEVRKKRIIKEPVNFTNLIVSITGIIIIILGSPFKKKMLTEILFLFSNLFNTVRFEKKNKIYTEIKNLYFKDFND